MRAVNVTRGTVVAQEVELARDFWSRLRGLIGRPSLPPGCGLWLEPCDQIHTFWMAFAIDAAFLAPDGRVLAAMANLAPGRAWPRVAGARACLELPAGTLAATGTQVEDVIRLEP